MSIDSLKVWRAAMLPDVYLNDHPFLNVILYKYLYHIWNNPAIVPLTQVFLSSLLVSWFGFWLYRQGVKSMLVLLWLLFILCSVPIGVYNIMLWKDIPYALLVVFWACLLIQLYQEKRQGRLHWSQQRIVALLLLGLALGLVRHNGLIYFAVLPLLLLALVSIKKALLALAALLFVGGIGFAALQHTGKILGTTFLSQQIQQYTGNLKAKNIIKNSERTFQNYTTVLDINQKQQQWDKFHHYFQDRSAWWFFRLSGWWDLYPYQQETRRFPKLRQMAMEVYQQSNLEPWVWLSWNPRWLLGALPVLTLLFWWFPHTAILGIVLLTGALPLIYLRIFNWRYYYFLYFGLLFLPALMSLDLSCLTKSKNNSLCVSPS
ncbi:MAG: hypothetical protein D3923_13975 [Candidatus Electrothrix sp. AR3]|nr:hypothetical protein [Candidatus Electrothrix sp. AR3]